MNKVYVKENRSIFTISRNRILLLIPMILYGLYKNGLFLYRKGYVDLFSLFKPLMMLGIGILIGCLVNIIYEYLFKRSKDKFINVLFSSFHIEYGIITSSILAINTNIVIYSIVTFIVFITSKILNNRVNTVALTFITIYIVSILTNNPFTFINSYENDKTLSLTFFDYLIGRGVGGMLSTNTLLMLLSCILLYLTDNFKINITISSLLTYIILVIIGSFIFKYNIVNILFLPNILYALSFIATDLVTSPYTDKGQVIYGILISIITYILNFYIPTISVFVTIVIISLFNSIIDRIVNRKKCKVTLS